MADAQHPAAFCQYLAVTLQFQANLSNVITNNGISSVEELVQLDTLGIDDLV